MRREQSPLTTFSGATPVSLEGKLSILPDEKSLEDIITHIDHAEKRIWVEIYTWTEKETIIRVIAAHKRGVDVRVILEGNVYRTPRINDAVFSLLQKEGISVVYADNTRYTFTHAKMWIIDDRWCVSTGNWSYTTFTKNREFIYCSKDGALMDNFEEIFLSDFSHITPYFSLGIDPRLGLSPKNMRNWILSNIGKTKKTLYIYNQTVSDPEIIALLEEKARSGFDIRVCQAYRDEGDTDEKYPGKKYAFVSAQLKKPYLHAKMMLRDDEEIILGSINFTQNALDNNREFAISLGKNTDLYSQLKKLFLTDCFP